MADRIIYGGGEDQPGPFEVAKLSREETERLAPQLMVVTGLAWEAALVDRHRLVNDRGVIQRKFDPENPGSLAAFTARALRLHDLGSRISVRRMHPRANDLAGYTKIGPAAAMTENDAGEPAFPNGWYLNNVKVHPDLWHRGLGGMLMHAGFKLNECDPDDPVVLDAVVGHENGTILKDHQFTGNADANAWYERMGFRRRPDIPTDTLDMGEGVELPEEYYEADAVRGLTSYLEARTPLLVDHVIEWNY